MRNLKINTIFTMLRKTPEAVIMFYLFGLMFIGPIQEQYLYQEYSKQLGFNYSFNEPTSNCPADEPTNSTRRVLQKQVQSKVAKFLTATQLCTLLPATIMGLYLGPIADRFGRKPVMILSLSGSFVASLNLILVAALKLNVIFILLSSLAMGLSGYYTTLIMVVCAYMADTVEKDKLALRIAILELLVFLAVTLSNFSSGVFLQTFGFIYSFITVSILVGVATLGAIFVLKESLPKDNRLNTKFSICSYPCRVLRVVFASRPKKWKFLVYIAINIVNVFTSSAAVLPVLILYFLNTPFCWSPQNIGFYRGTFFAAAGIGGAIGVKVLPKFTPEVVTIGISVLSSAGYLVVLSFSKTMLMAYLGILVSIFGATGYALLCSILSAMVQQTEQGSLFAFIWCVRALFTFGGNFLYQKLYQVLNDRDQAGKAFLVGSFTCIIPLMLLLGVWLKEMKQRFGNKNVDVIEENDETKPLIRHD